jgi:hypothetical protein
MPGPKQPERGTKSPYTARYGVDVGFCTGLNLGQDPSTLAETDLRQAVNVRVHDGIPISRGGQSSQATGMTGCVQGLIGIEGVGTRGVVATNETGGEPKAAIGMFDENLRAVPPDESNFFLATGQFQEHPAQGNANGGTFEDTRPRYVYTWWDGSVIFQDIEGDGDLFKLILPEKGTAPADLRRESLFPLTVPGEVSAISVSSFANLPSVGSVRSAAPLYMGTMAGGVVAYSQGQLIRILADATFAGRVILFAYNNQVYAAGAHKVMYQSNGWASGGSSVGTAWTNVALPAGPSDFRPMCGTEGLGFGWIGGYDDDDSPPAAGVDSGYILKVDDSSGTPVITVALNSEPGGNNLYSVDDFTMGPQGVLYAAWRHGTPGGSFFADFGTWNGTTISAKYGWGESDAMCQRIAGSASKVYATGWGSDSDTELVAYDGSSVTIVKWDTENDVPFDMVLF